VGVVVVRRSELHALHPCHDGGRPELFPTPGDVARAEAERLNNLGLGDNPDHD
jgi:hypothetical protein